jgi:hypothetical protein
MTVVGEPVEQRGCHLGVTENGSPFTEAQVVVMMTLVRS